MPSEQDTRDFPPDDSYVLRRIPPDRFVFDHRIGRVRPQSDTFDDDDDSPCSIVIGEILRQQGRGEMEVLAGHEGYLLVRVKVSEVRRQNLSIEPFPTPEEPAHGYLVGTKTGGRKKALARAAEWVVPPPEFKNPSE